MKIEKALKKAAKVPKKFHAQLGKMLMSDVKKEINSGRDVHGQRFTPLTPKYRKYKRKQGGTGRADMKLTGKMLNSSYFKAPKMTGANSWKATTGNTKEGIKILAHSDKIKMPKGLPVRPIIGNQPKDDVVHPKLKKEFLRVYSERLFRTISKIPKKEFL
jgi:hypothetical protein